MTDSYPTFTEEELKAEIWKPIPDWEGCYEASSLGRIRSARTKNNTFAGKILKPGRKSKYPNVVLTRPGDRRRYPRTVHSLVALTFLGPPPMGKEVNHKDGIKFNCRVDNLEYLTHKQNKRHSVDLGLVPLGDNHWTRQHPEKLKRGEEHWRSLHPELVARGDDHWMRRHPELIRRGSSHQNAKLTYADVQAVRILLSQGIPGKVIARWFDVTDGVISRIKLKKGYIYD